MNKFFLCLCICIKSEQAIQKEAKCSLLIRERRITWQRISIRGRRWWENGRSAHWRYRKWATYMYLPQISFWGQAKHSNATRGEATTLLPAWSVHLSSTYLTGHFWRGKYEEQPKIPKDKWYELMVSAFQSRELGFGYKLFSEQLATINSFQQSTRPH